MNVHFNDTQPADASANTLFDVITDYANYPSFNPSVTGVTVLRKDERGAEFLADRKTRIGKQAHSLDRYKVDGSVFAIERTYDGIDGSSTWLICSLGDGRSTLTIEGTMRVSLLRGLLMRLLLKRILYGTDFKPFIEEAERRELEARSQRAA